MKKNKESFFYNPNLTRSHNKLFNFVIGNRRSGKTYGCIKDLITRFIKTGETGIYLRRYKTELKKFNDLVKPLIMNNEFPDHEITTKGKTIYVNDKPCIYGLPLSTGKVEKGSNPVNVSTIVFDEFLIETGVYHYLQDEVSTFLDLYISVSSYRPVTVFFLANAITVTNPYFLYFDLRLPHNSNFWKKKNSDIMVEMVNDSSFIDYVKKTRVGNFLVNEAPDYANYAIMNEFYLDDESFIEKRPATAYHVFNFVYKNKYIGVWLDGGTMYLSEKYNPESVLNFAVTNKDHSTNTLLLKNRGKGSSFRLFLDLYESGNCYFENVNLKNIGYDIIKRSYR